MKKVLPWLDKNFEPIIITFLFYMIVAIVTTQVILRFGFSSGFSWAEELSRFLFIWLMYFAFSYATRNNMHIKVSFVLDKLNEKFQKILLIVVDFLFIVFSLILFLASIRICQSIIAFGDKAVTMDISMNIVYGAGVVGFLLMIIRLLQQIIWKFINFKRPMEIFETYKGASREEEVIVLAKR
ncbi:hypothetical protein J18TS1_33650 [Oceanobacillus oncorhynchi subsp. incaldanensis]|uniref:TRAP transporter small permease n=1 Tax=Oceanobacillus oncorhynchi TaxID=545501 RepID=UPI001B19348D|nr:TRAP transporter small permease [Oceanobacillus oncorhynchi]GIO20265.1 hypothetical protein J18TS1_33650 [Oceanobacillus oncorhynchi subsp. incaldanensis]